MQARFQRAEDADAHALALAHAHVARGERGVEKLRVVARRHGDLAGGLRVDGFVERQRQRRAVLAGKGGVEFVGVAGERDHAVAMAGGQRGERQAVAAGNASGASASPSAFTSSSAAASAPSLTSRRGSLRWSVGAPGAIGRKRMRQAGDSGLGPRPAQHRALERRALREVRVGRRAEPQQRMLEQSEQRHRREPAERDFRGQPCEHAGRRVGERIAARVVDRYVPAFERGQDTSGQCAIRCYERGRFPGCICGLAQDHRHGERLLLGIGRLDQRHRRQCGGGRSRRFARAACH